MGRARLQMLGMSRGKKVGRARLQMLSMSRGRIETRSILQRRDLCAGEAGDSLDQVWTDIVHKAAVLLYMILPLAFAVI